MANLRSRVADSIIKRTVEEAVEKALSDPASSGDGNSIARKFFRLVYADDTPLAMAVKALPGVRYTPSIGLSLAAEYLRDHADEILPGDNRVIIRVLRHVLRVVAPTLEGVGSAASDVLERKIDDSVDAAKASDSTPTRKGKLDFVLVWMVDGKAHLIFPLIKPDGSVQTDSLGDPVPSNLSPALLSRWLSDEFTKGKTKQVANKGGKGIHEESIPPAKRQLTEEIGLPAAIQMIGGVEAIAPDQVDGIKALLKQPPSRESQISPNVDKVLNWLVDVLSVQALSITPLERQEVEDLVQRMNQAKPEPSLMNSHLGRFEKETKKFPLNKGRAYTAAELAQIRTLFRRICDAIDILLGGEQSQTTKARKLLAVAPDAISQVRVLFSSSAPWVENGLLWWLIAVILAVVLLLMGILLPVKWVGVPCFTLGALLTSVAGGIIGFAITWPFPLIQKVYDYLQKFMSGYSTDSVNSLGRRIASFALCMGAGVLPLTIWFEFPVVVRAGIVAFGGLFPIGIMFALKEAGYPDLAQRLAKRSLLVANIIFGTLAVVMMAFVGFVASYTGKFMTGPQFLRWAVNGVVDVASSAVSWLHSFHWWHYLGLGVLALIVLFAVLFVVWILKGGSSKPAGTGGGNDDDLKSAAILIGGLGFVFTMGVLLLLAVVLVFGGLHYIASLF